MKRPSLIEQLYEEAYALEMAARDFKEHCKRPVRHFFPTQAVRKAYSRFETAYEAFISNGSED